MLSMDEIKTILFKILLGTGAIFWLITIGHWMGAF